MSSRAWLVVALAPAIAAAEPRPGVIHAPERAAPPAAQAAPVLYLNRCTGGCTIHAGTDDAATDTSGIPCSPGHTDCSSGNSCSCDLAVGDFHLSEFTSSTDQTGAAADAEWNAVVQCVKEAYSPYALTVTDVRPVGQAYNMALVAGLPTEFGYTDDWGGFGPPAAAGCAPQSNVTSVTFEGVYHGSGQARIWKICGVVAQESGHAYGLDHEYAFSDGTSACRSPMTYRNDCGGEKFFRGVPATCGEYAGRVCRCGGLQASHHKLLEILGPGTPITTPPHVTITGPSDGTQIANGAAVGITAGAQRGVQRLELWLNGHDWAQTTGAAWGANGQPDPSSYGITLPTTVPDGVIDIQIKAYDDIDIETDSTIVTVTKGAPCTSATTCLKGQKCDAGKCYWDPPTGLLGTPCDYDEFCVSNKCSDTVDQPVCTQSCVLGSVDGCPMGYDCIATSESEGICYPAGAGGGGCCSVSGLTALAAHGGLAALVLGLVLRRRRR